MYSFPTSEQVELFKSVFNGRADVFAIRWEKGNKSGYMPAYSLDPYFYRLHKAKGGTFKNFKDKSYLPLTDEQIAKHLKGEQLIGIYPLLHDNTSWFLAADFDGEKWANECEAFMQACQAKGIISYLERSRSGKGGHVWIFFEEPYPAVHSRKIFISILQESEMYSAFDKSSFDRLFPNQDYHSGKGLGNLIALPFYKRTMEQGNSCFLDPKSLQPIDNQWEYLKKIVRISRKNLDSLLNSTSTSNVVSESMGRLAISLSETIQVNRSGLTLSVVNLLREELNIPNQEFYIKQKSGRSTHGIPRYFKCLEEKVHEIVIPKGFTGKLLRYCKEQNLEFEFKDNRRKLNFVPFSFKAKLRSFQEQVIDATLKKDIGIIVAPPGSGKTIIALKIISDKQQPALIIVHRKQLAEQWIERIQTFLGIPKHEIGQGKVKKGNKITVSTIQSLSKAVLNPASNEILTAFGTIIIDECHHVPATMYNSTISKLNSYYQYGLTATPFRKYNDEKLIFIYLGEIISEIKSGDIGQLKTPKIKIQNTTLEIPFNSKTDSFETLSKVLIHDSQRNKLILNDVKKEVEAGNKSIIITERKEHLDSLNQYLKQQYETIVLSGDDSENSRKIKWKEVKAGNYQVLITTGQFFGEGSDIEGVHCLFLVYPFSFEGKLIQYIGRVQRSEIAPTIYDYRDIKIDYLNRLFLRRNSYYRKIERIPTLFDDLEEVSEKHKPAIVTIERDIKVPLEKLDFNYGGVSFKYKAEEVGIDLEIDIENIDIRPEFEVMKPYFKKALKAKSVRVHLYAEFENGMPVSLLATSPEIKKISREIIEGVKFRFVSRQFLEKPLTDGSNELLDIDQLQENKSSLYNTGEKLLRDILQNKNYKHSRHLQYLADKHERTVLKLRFVLSPFSFVFLLKGKSDFHFVLETLDTEEATYLWHFDADKRSIPTILRQVDKYLTEIRNNGRQAFLENAPNNFAKINHDYTDERKGFIIWKGNLEELLT
jgi:superfamily II DNA or RNA helicase